MDDLDALLADLQTTSKNISNFDHQPQPAQQTHYATPNKSHQTHQQQTIVEMRNASESPPPPPLPPPPAQDVLDSLNEDSQQPLYEPQQVVQSPGNHRVNTSYSQQPQSPSPEYSQISPDYRQLSPSSPLPKPDPTMTSMGSPKKKTPPPVPAKPAMSASRTGHQSPPPPAQTGGPHGVQSSLSNNLSELDILLQDLNSAQFMAEMDRRNSAGSQQQISPKSSGTPVKPGAEERARAIDSFVDDLRESDATSPGYSTIADYPSPVSGHYHVVNGPASNSIGQQPAASSATKELDDLMASLSNFKVNVTAGAGGEPAYAKPNKPTSGSSPQGASQSKGQTQLDAMLGNLQSDMSKQGVNTTAKGHCAACQKPIVGQVITALGKIWHPEHFTCDECHGELGTKNFFERDGKPYCERDYHNLFSPKCAYCNGPVLDKCVTALDRTWHPEHFFCAQCGRTFGDDGFHEKDGKAYCREDYFEMFAPKCGGCSRPIMDNYISALNKQWHPECFVCRDCHVAFNGASFFDHEGMPYCETHYHAKRGSLCAGCQKPITGRCITAMYKKFHPEHFVCAFCLKQLNKGTFKEQNDKPYCHSCFVKLFG